MMSNTVQHPQHAVGVVDLEQINASSNQLNASGAGITNNLSSPLVLSQVNLNEGDVVNVHHHYHAAPNHPTRQPLSSDDIGFVQTQLTTRAEMISRRVEPTFHTVFKRSSRAMTLQISSKIGRSLDFDGHYHERQDFLNIQRTCYGDLELKELFNAAENRASEPDLTTDEEGSDTVQHQGNSVALLGQGGIGKTTLSNMMLKLILDREVLANREYIIYIPFREINYLTAITLNQFLMTGCDCDWNQIGDLFSLLKDNSNIVFMFDGLDEARTDLFKEQYVHCDIHSYQKPDVFLSSILSGNLFPKSKKLITSRPQQFFSLHADHRPNFVADILGLDKTSQKALGREICGPFFDFKVKEVLKYYPDILACCYVPVNCVIYFNVVSKLIKDGENIGTLSLTSIFVEALGIFVRTLHVRNKNVLKLTILAWNGISNGKIIFGEEDFRRLDIKHDDIFQAFLNTFITEEISFAILEGDKVSSFTHLIWQELFAAIYIAICMSATEFKTYIEQLNEPLWEVFSKFLFGFCDPILQKKLEKIFYPNVFKDWKEKKSMLCDLIVKSLDNFRSSPYFLRLCSWIQEAHNDELNAAVSAHLPEEINIEGLFLPTDAHNLIYILKLGEQPVTLRLCNARFIQDSFTRLTNELSSIPINELDLELNGIGDEGAREIANGLRNETRIETLTLYGCDITAAGACAIGEALPSLLFPMTELDLSRNAIGDEGARKIANSLHMVKTLNLFACAITAAGACAIGDALASLPVPMNELDLRWNNIGDEGTRKIANGLRMVETLTLERCEITAAGACAIGDALASLSVPMNKLDLDYNNIGDEGTRKIANGLHMVETLSLCGCSLTETAVNVLSERLASLPDSKPEVLL